MLNRVIIGLGSNLDKEKNMAAAVRLLEDCFVSIRFSAAVYTEPVGMNNPALFLNRVAVAFTSEEPDRLVAAFKHRHRPASMERPYSEAGRSSTGVCKSRNPFPAGGQIRWS